MYYPISFFIGLRYIISSRCTTVDRSSYFIYFLSTVGITISVIALVIVLSVMNGFEHKLQNNIFRVIPHVILTSTLGSLNPKEIPKNTITKLKGVSRITQLTTSNVIVQNANKVVMGTMLGLDCKQKEYLAPYLVDIKNNLLESNKYNVIVGKNLALEMNIHYGDQIRLIVPSVNLFTPIGLISSQRLFNVIGTFITNSEVDSYQLLVNIQDASRVMHYPVGNVTGLRLWLNNPLNLDEITQQSLPSNLSWKDWRESKGDLFQAIKMEKNIIVLLLSLIVIVAIFNIATSLGLMVIERCSEIAILQTQGMKLHQIMMIFIVQGVTIGIIGTVIGLILGIILSSNINKIIIATTSNLFKNTVLPVVINPLQLIIISLAIIIMTLLAIVYPSWYATTIQPAKVLRYE